MCRCVHPLSALYITCKRFCAVCTAGWRLLYLEAFCNQAYIVEFEFLDTPQLLLSSQGQSGIKDVHLTLCLANNIPLKSCTSDRVVHDELNVSSNIQCACTSLPVKGQAPCASTKADPCLVQRPACETITPNAVDDAARPLKQLLSPAHPLAVVPCARLLPKLLLHGARVADAHVVPSAEA